MDHFEWHTDEDGNGEALERSAAEPRLTPRRRRLLTLILLLAGVLAFTGYRLYHSGQERVAEATASTEADVRASHELVSRAALQADLELFTRFSSSADPDWARAQEQLIAGKRWLDRSTMDLTWQETLSTTAAITLSADLLEANVVSHEAYTFIDVSGEQEEARLAQTRVYRLGPDRWLIAPPRDVFWGEEETVELPRLRLTYPARDEALARRLARDLSDLIARACGELEDIRCAHDYRLSAHFTRDLTLLQRGQSGALPLWTREPLTLPTPSLVGLPLDEAAYRALYLGYARHVTAVALSQLVDWHCCQQGLFFQALLEAQWQALGLVPAPQKPPATAYSQMLQSQLDVGNASNLWEQVPVAGDTASLQSARAIVAFLRQRFPQRSVSAWQRALGDSERYPQWLAAVTDDAAGPALAMGWHSYLYEHTADDEPQTAPQMPDEDLLLLCDAQGAGRRLMRFDPRTETFSREIDRPPFVMDTARAVLSLAPPDGVFFAGHEEGALQIWRWQNGQQRLIWDSGPPDSTRYRFEGASPGGHFIVVEVNDPQRLLPNYRVAEVESCLNEGCNWRQTVYRPTWSPDDRYAIHATPQGNMLYLAEIGVRTQSFWYMDVGGAPVWLGPNTFAYVKQRAGELSAVVLTAVDKRQVQTLVDVTDLRPQLPPGAIVAPGVGLARHPADGQVLFVALQTVRSDQPTSTYVFLARRDTGQLFNLFSAANADPQSLSVSPAGRWLALATEEGLLLYDLVMDRGGIYSEGLQQIGPLWSPNGDWLFSGSEGRYTMIAPGKEVREMQAEVVSCEAAVWLEEG